MNTEPSNVFTGRPFSLLVRPSDITAPPVHNMNRFNPYTSAEKVDLGQELSKLREESINLPPLPIDSEQLRVYVRLRPTDLPDEQVDKTYKIEGGQRLYVSQTTAGATAEHELRFSHIFSYKATQQEVFFGAARPLVFNFISGDNALIFAYGCTSSGKTFTIEGTHDNPGILPRCIQTIFCQLNVVEQHRLQPLRFNEYNILSTRQAEDAATEKEALFEKIRSEVKNVHFDHDPSVSCFFPDALQQSGRSCSLFMAFVEIYNNSVYDLLGSSENFGVKNTKHNRNQPKGKGKHQMEPRDPLQVGEDIAHNTYIKELRWVQVSSAQEALELVAFAQKNMTFASTYFNMNSSRSHVICFTRLAYWNVNSEVMETERVTNVTGGISSYCDEEYIQTLEVEKSSIMAICDLAGSERQAAGLPGAERLREAGNINTDLLTLGQCLTGMHNNQIASRKMQARQNPAAGAVAVVAKKKPTEEPVPYRSCRLTYLLKAFLVGGRAHVAMISAIVPTVDLLEQNLQVLRYAAFASEVVVYRKLEPAVIEKFQKAKQKHQTMAVAKAARRLSQAPRGRHALHGSAKKNVSEGTPITAELVKIQEEMGDALDAQLVVAPGIDEDGGKDEFSDDSDEADSDAENAYEEEDEEGMGDETNLTKDKLVELLRNVCEECKQLNEENASLLEAKKAAELEAKRQRGYYEMMKEKFKESVEEIEELKASMPCVDECIDTEGLLVGKSPMLPKPQIKPDRPTLKHEKTSLIAALSLAEPSLHWQASLKLAATTLWTDEESVSRPQGHADKRKIREISDVDEEVSPMKKSRLQTPLAAPLQPASTHAPTDQKLRHERIAASPSPMPINKFSTHTKASILRMRMHQANVIKERHNSVQMRTPVLQPTNPDDMSLDEAVPSMPSELSRRLEQIQMLKHTLSEVEEQRDELQRRLNDAPDINSFHSIEEMVLKLKADLEFEKQLCQQNASEAEALRCQNVELLGKIETTKNTEHSLSEELGRRVGEIGRLKERISELQHDLQTVYEELNSSRAGRENESTVLNDQLESMRRQISGKDDDIVKMNLLMVQKTQEADELRGRLTALEEKMSHIEKEREMLLDSARCREERGNTTGRLEELQFDVDEANVELETTRNRARCLEESNKAFENQLQVLRRQIEEKCLEISVLQTRIEDLERQFSERVASFNEERDNFAKSSREAVGSMEEQLATAKNERDDKLAEVTFLKNTVTDLEGLVSELKGKLSTCEDAVNKLKEVQSDYDKTMSKLSEKSSENAELKVRVSQLELVAAQLSQVEAAHEKALADISTKSSELSTLQSKLSDVENSANSDSKRLNTEIAFLTEKINGLESDLTTAMSEKASLLKQLSDASCSALTANQQFDAEKVSLKTKLASLESELAVASSEKASFLEKLHTTEEQCASVKNAIDLKDEEIADLRIKFSEYEAEIKKKNAEYEHMLNRYGAVEQELIAANKEIDNCKAEFDNERLLLTKSCEEDTKTLLNDKAAMIHQLELRLDDATKTVANQKSQIAQLTEEHVVYITELESKLTSLRSENSSFSSKEAEMRSQFDSFKATVVSSMKQTVYVYKKSIGAIEERLSEALDRVKNYQSLILQLRQTVKVNSNEKMTALEERIDNLVEHRDAMVEALNGRIKGMEADMKDKDNEIVVLRKDRDAARDKEEKSLRTADEKCQEVAELRDQVETLNDRLSTVSVKLQEYQDQFIQKNADLQLLSENYSSASTECQVLRQKVKDLEEAGEIQRQEQKDDSASYLKILRELSEKKDVVAQKNARISELEHEVQRLSGNIERLESVLATKESQIAKLAHEHGSGGSQESTSQVESGHGGKTKRTAKRKQEAAPAEQEPSDSEMDALVTAQMHIVSQVKESDEHSVHVEEVSADVTTKKRRRRRAVSKEPQPTAPEHVEMPKMLSDPAAHTSSKTRSGAITRARARGRQRNAPRDEQIDGDENTTSETTRHNTRKRAADHQTNVQSHLLTNFEGNDAGSYV